MRDKKGRFVKGYRSSPETEFKKGEPSLRKGTHQSEKSKLKMSESTKRTYKRKKNYGFQKNHKILAGCEKGWFKKGCISWNKNIPRTEKTKEKMRHTRSKMILPKKDTKIEVKLQDFLKQLNTKFISHKYINNIEHSYQCDIFIEPNIIIECDGDYWHNWPYGRKIDIIRTQELKEKGFKVLRLWESEINKMTLKTFKSELKKLK